MSGGSTILVADDDRAIRTVLSQALGRLGHEVRTTGNAATLWRWVSDGEGDLVITDVVMPDENGLDLVPRIKKLRPELRIIVMSAQNTLLTAVKATERGAFEYLPKPFDLRELVNVVRRALTSLACRRARAGPRRRRRGTAAAHRPLAGDAGNLPRAGAAHGHRSHGDDHRRERHRQGAGGARAARLRQAPERSVRRGQHGGDSARADRERAVRPREGLVHRRDRARRRPLRASASRHPVPRRDRRHAARSADAAPARAAAGRIHHRRRPHADPRRCADHRRDPSRPAPAHPSGPVPRGLVLSPQRGADPAAAAARAQRGHTGAGAALLHACGFRGAAAQDDRQCGDGAAQGLSLAGQCARARESRPPARGALFAGGHRRRCDRGRAGRDPSPRAGGRGAEQRGAVRRRRAPSARLFRRA